MFTAESTRMRVEIRTSGTGRTVVLRTARKDDLLKQHIESLPQRARRWDKYVGVWRVSVAWIDHLVDALTREGFEVVDERTSK